MSSRSGALIFACALAFGSCAGPAAAKAFLANDYRAGGFRNIEAYNLIALFRGALWNQIRPHARRYLAGPPGAGFGG